MCVTVSPMQQRLTDIALPPARQSDESLSVIANPLQPDSRSPQILSLLISTRQQHHQVVVTDLVLCEQTQLVVALLIYGINHVQIGTDNQFDAKR